MKKDIDYFEFCKMKGLNPISLEHYKEYIEMYKKYLESVGK